MLRLPAMEVVYPETWEEASEILRDHPEGRLLAGGTDLLPGMKLGHLRCPLLVSLRRLPPPLVRLREDHLALDAAMPLADLARHPLVQAWVPSLSQACARVAGPQIRQRATLAGNLCQDVRCRYLNQSELWRESLGGCLKCAGDRCHVVPGGTRCVAAFCSDLAPLLIALDASLELTGDRTLPLIELYGSDGSSHLTLKPGELILRVRLPFPHPATRATSRKWSPRGSLDFPQVAVAVRLEVPEGVVESGRVVVGAMSPRPRVLDLNDAAGHQPGPALARAVAARVRAACRPLANVPGNAEYRRDRLEIEVMRAVEELG